MPTNRKNLPQAPKNPPQAPKNPLLERRFEIAFDAIAPEHVEPAIEQLIADADAAIDAVADATDPRTYASTIGALDAATENLEYAVGIVAHLESVMTSDALRAAWNAARPAVAAFYSSISLNAGLYAALRAFADTSEAAALDPTRRRHLDKLLADFRRHGAELGAKDKEALSAIDVELSALTTRFSQNVLDATNAFELVVTDEARLAGLPDSARAAAAESAKSKGVTGWRFTLQAPSFVPVITYADDAALRESLWSAFTMRASAATNDGKYDNAPLLDDILRLRGERARLLGYANFAELVLEDRMAGNSAKAISFTDELREKTAAAFERENAELAEFRRQLEGENAPALAPWDVSYDAEKQRRALYDFDEAALRPYLPAEAAIESAFEVARRLYNVRIERDDSLPVWHETVRTFRLENADGTHLASFYADLYPRETKRDGAWMNALITGVDSGDELQPHLGLICGNLNPPVGDRPALLTHRDVETLFHEFGHLMHQCLSRVSVRALAGANVAWDFVELPSQIMENWCWERAALDLLGGHYASGEALPDALFESMRRARTFRAANAMMRQLGFAAVDLALHVEYDPARDGSATDYGHRILEQHAPTALPEEYAMLLGFTHLFASPVGYAAGYYSYKWAEVLDADAFSRFREEGIFSAKVGADFRDHVLAKGDSEDPMALFEGFMGRGPRVEPLLERAGLLAAA